MNRFISRIVLMVLVLGLLIGVSARAPAMPHASPFGLRGVIQPFLLALHRYDHHAIVFLADHPDYRAIEAMITYRADRPPLIRAFITLHDGTQIDHSSDPEFVRDRAAILTDRQIIYRPIRFEVSEVGGVPREEAQFISYRGENIHLVVEGSAPPSPALGGLINPGGDAGDLAILWADASSLASDASVLTIDEAPVALSSPVPGVYTAGLHIGVFYDGHLELRPIRTPSRIAVGESWLYRDNLRNWHVYEIVAVAGDQLTLRKTTTSPALTEEILEAEVVHGRIELRSVRATGLPGDEEPIPPAPTGLTLDLSTPGSFSISLDEHEDLVTGTASRTEHPARTVWTLQPVEPPWMANLVVTATVTLRRNIYSIDGEASEP
ncbi:MULTISPECIES: hypothetical protein [Sorangium]|uniref:Uncharacterized protein n=1 Tax=Sorangium cellulosum TaxID=56 RepID=A0A3Q8I932_SORCE|nr:MULTISPECIES: hypothetical protein [Sorangium]AUX30549.1 uncharacterized protein SOCE836_026580 [Sorangium cellulosum]AYM53030.1 hypothetical protein [Sorangium cellulosum]WCQ89944.1 hypothetical protein NQZ70_02642 [Sorangium sp. Soce836]